MRILHVIFSQGLGGSEAAVAALARQQMRAGHAVQVMIARQHAAPNIRDWLAPDVEAVEAGRWRRAAQLKAQIKAFRPDVVHTHLGKASRLVGQLALPCPAVATLHVGYKPKDYARLDGLICLNPAQQATLTDFQGARDVIPLMLPHLPDRRIDWRRDWGIPADAFVIGTVGRLHLLKGQADLLAAFLALDAPQAHVVVVGSGPEEARLWAMYSGQPRVHFTGALPTDASLYRAFDVFVSPSHTETFGLVLLEAMQAGCPLIATETVGAAFVLQDQPATMVPVQDIPALTTALQAAVAHGPGQRVTYDTSAFSPAEVCQRVVGFYKIVR